MEEGHEQDKEEEEEEEKCQSNVEGVGLKM